MKFNPLPSLLFLLLTAPGVFAQNRYDFEDFQGFKVFENGDSLELAWAGGMNYMQFGEIDLNLDGKKDLLAFDRAGNRIMPFENKGTAATPRYRYAPQYIKNFPPLKGWVRLVDYNCDGKEDIFCSVSLGIGVYENTSSSDLSFSWALGTYNYLTTNYGSPVDVNLYVTEQDVPAIVDADGDGDIDVLTFGLLGTSVEWHENQASCGLDFFMSDNCWGEFRENFSNNSLNLDACSGGKPAPGENGKTMHSGSTLLGLDLDGNALLDMILGDVSFNNAAAAFNTGIPDSAYMSSQDSVFPSYDTPVDLFVFPVFSLADVTGDGREDFLVSPNVSGSTNFNSVWMYEDQGTGAAKQFHRITTSFLQSDMIETGESAFPVLADLNGDGLTDLVVGNGGYYQSGGNYTSQLRYYENTGTSSEPEFTLSDPDLAGLSGLSLGSHLVPAFGDLDGDNDLDLIIGDLNGNLHLFENTGTATSPVFTLAAGNLGGIDVGGNAAPFLHDLTGDGHPDLVVGEQAGNLNYYRNNGTGFPPSFTLESSTWGGVDVKNTTSNFGYSMPVLFEDSGKTVLMVGSYNLGVVQYDSIAQVMNNPSEIIETFGTGTLTSANHDETLFGTSKRTGRNQFLIRAEELQAAGFIAGKIRSLGFNITTTNNPVFSQGLDIRMKQTADTVLAGFHEDTQLAYTAITVFTQGWQDLNLHYPFEWDGVSNLLIEVCFSKNLPNPDIHIQMTDVGWDSHSYGDVSSWNTNTAKGCEMPYLATVTKRPNTRIKINPGFCRVDTFYSGGFHSAPALADLDGDDYRELITGNLSGGLTLQRGIPYVAPPVSLPETAQPEVLGIYPNPGRGFFTIRLPEGTQPSQWRSIRVFDLQGRLVFTAGKITEALTLDLRHLPPGLYTAVAEGPSRFGSAKLVILP